MSFQHPPILGGTAPRNAVRTARKLSDSAIKHVSSIQNHSEMKRYLDVGCGNGFITEYVAKSFDHVVGIDVEANRLEEFRYNVNNNSKYTIFEMSSDKIEFPDKYFSFITSFEVLEHVIDIEMTVNEMIRVCDIGGVIIVSVPQIWFPFENHGVKIGNRIFEHKIPFLPYIRPLHRKYSLARVFSSTGLDNLFTTRGLRLLETAYISPQFERAGSNEHSWENRLIFLRSILEMCENIPILRVLTGVSMIKAYQKPF